jgi:uncharacterized sulfatase
MQKTITAILLLVCWLTSLANAQSSRPNIVFVLIDDLGYGDFSCTGNQDVQTENIDRLAAEGTRWRCVTATGNFCATPMAQKLSCMIYVVTRTKRTTS